MTSQIIEDISSIEEEEAKVRRRRRVLLGVAILLGLHGYYFAYPYLFHSMRVPLFWLLPIPSLFPFACGALLIVWLRRKRPQLPDFTPIPPLNKENLWKP